MTRNHDGQQEDRLLRLGRFAPTRDHIHLLGQGAEDARWEFIYLVATSEINAVNSSTQREKDIKDLADLFMLATLNEGHHEET